MSEYIADNFVNKSYIVIYELWAILYIMNSKK